MNRLLVLSILAVMLSGCGTLSGLTGGQDKAEQVEILRALGDHIDNCDRRYQGSLGLGGGFTFNIDCKARTTPQS